MNNKNQKGLEDFYQEIAENQKKEQMVKETKHNEKVLSNSNTISNILKVCAFVIIGLGVLVFLMFASSNDDVGIGIIYAIGCGISSLLFFTASEVV